MRTPPMLGAPVARRAAAFVAVLVAAMLLAARAPTAAAAQLDAAVTLDPETRVLQGQATLDLGKGATEVVLSARFEVESFVVDGRRRDAGALRDGRRVWRLPAARAARRVEIAWRGVLAPLDATLSHRETLRSAEPVAGARGSFLPASTLWHPTVASGFAKYSLALDLPAGQKGVAPGRLVEETEAGGRYRARIELAFPSDGIDLLVGPYRVEERTATSVTGATLRLRTYFHAEIADLAPGYIDSVAGFIDLYERWIAPYPFGEFSVVSSPTPTGFGMPTLTYLGVDVLRLPFIRTTSLGHEVLHNWWGNGVLPDHARGNWSEGLTTFMADYAYKERESEEAARALRLDWLRDLAALPPGADRPITSFTARYHGASQIVGYHKAALVFLMLRDRIGREAFDDGVRRFWREHRFKAASWADLRRAFEAAHGASLEPFFAQWLARSGLPALRLAGAEAVPRSGGYRLRVTLAQDAPAYRLRVPLAVRTAQGETLQTVEMDGERKTFAFDVEARPLAIALDPDLRLARRLGPDEAPPILRALMVDPATALVVVSPVLAAEAHALAARVLDHAPKALAAEGTPPAAPLLVVGLREDVDAWFARTGASARPAQAERGEAQVWVGARAAAGPVGVISVRDAAALAALARALPHYGRSSWLVLAGGRVVERGSWPARPQTWRFE